MSATIIYTSNKAEALAKIKEAIKNALEICGGTAEGHAKEKCPVQSGVLRNSIAHEPRGDDTVAIGTNIEYAPFVEFGHNQEPGRYVPVLGKRLVADHVAAKPYMVPALNEHEQEYVNIVAGELNKI